MSTRVLVLSRASCPALPESGVRPWRAGDWPAEWHWLPRSEAETDERHLQVIPYGLIRNGRGELWCYARSGGDARLRRRLSAGVGGHVDEADAGDGFPATVERALRRELREELGWSAAPPELAPCAWLYEGLSAVGRVHVGLVYRLPWTAPQPPRPLEPEALQGIGFLPPRQVAADARFELWSRLAAEFLCGGPP